MNGPFGALVARQRLVHEVRSLVPVEAVLHERQPDLPAVTLAMQVVSSE